MHVMLNNCVLNLSLYTVCIAKGLLKAKDVENILPILINLILILLKELLPLFLEKRTLNLNRTSV